MNYRITFLPRSLGPFSEAVIIKSPELPIFRGGAVIVTEPVDIDGAVEPPPALMAWPLDMMSAVSVHKIT